MKKILLILFTLSFLFVQSQQHKFIDSILNQRIIHVPNYHLSNIGNESLLLKMNFAKPEIVDTTGIYQLIGSEILSVDLVFTDYPSANSLKPLNKKRIQHLIALLPFLVKQNSINWQIIRQTGGFDSTSSKNLLHGFVINYRHAVTKSSSLKELNYIKTVLNELPKPKVLQTAKSKTISPKPKVRYWDVIYGNGQAQTNAPVIYPRYLYGRTIKQIFNKKPKYIETGDSLIVYSIKEPILQRILLEEERKKFIHDDSVYVWLDAKPNAEATYPLNESRIITKTKRPLPDSSLIKILLRNNFTKALIVADVTSSMSVYTAQLLNWLCYQNKNIQFISCFNDGDDMPNEKKQLGNTGGIYGEPFISITQAGNLIETVMQRGSGGDAKENDCEALLKSIDMCLDCKDIVLIADNWAPVRDIELVKRIKQSVHVIICGGNIGMHPDYITIANSTNGTLHFMNEDLLDLSSLKQGKEILIRGKYYKLNDAGYAIEANAHQ